MKYVLVSSLVVENSRPWFQTSQSNNLDKNHKTPWIPSEPADRVRRAVAHRHDDQEVTHKNHVSVQTPENTANPNGIKYDLPSSEVSAD